MEQFYHLLGLTPGATQLEIRAAYKALSRKLHPDRNPQNAERFREIVNAYNVLSNRRGDSSTTNNKCSPTNANVLCTLEELYKGGTKKIVIRHDPASEPLTIQVPLCPGQKIGSKIHLPLMGLRRPGMTPGDLYLHVLDKPHQLFELRGVDLVLKHEIDLGTALRGTTLEIPLLNGSIHQQRVRGVIQPGYRVKVGDHLGFRQGDDTGDLFIEFTVKLPLVPSETLLEATATP